MWNIMDVTMFNVLVSTQDLAVADNKGKVMII